MNLKNKEENSRKHMQALLLDIYVQAYHVPYVNQTSRRRRVHKLLVI